jgi:predicted nucleic acid-binding protein
MKVFADTFFYLALLDSHDSAQEKAVSAARHLDSSTVTTAFVLLELANALSAPEHRRIFFDFLDKSRANPNIAIYEAERELFDEGVELYQTRPDKSWSLAD